MSNREKVTYSKLRLSKFKKFVSRLVYGELQLTQISLNFQTSYCNLKVRGLGEKLCVRLFYYFYFERNYGILKSKSPWFLLKKMRRNRKWKIPQTKSERWTMLFSSYMSCELKVKSWWVGACEGRKSGFFVTFIFPKEVFLTFVFYLIV